MFSRCVVVSVLKVQPCTALWKRWTGGYNPANTSWVQNTDQQAGSVELCLLEGRKEDSCKGVFALWLLFADEENWQGLKKNSTLNQLPPLLTLCGWLGSTWFLELTRPEEDTSVSFRLESVEQICVISGMMSDKYTVYGCTASWQQQQKDTSSSKTDGHDILVVDLMCSSVVKGYVVIIWTALVWPEPAVQIRLYR